MLLITVSSIGEPTIQHHIGCIFVGSFGEHRLQLFTEGIILAVSSVGGDCKI